MFGDEIASGMMVVKPASQAPPGTTGFPTFMYNRKKHAGLPQSKQQLYQKLGCDQNIIMYNCSYI